MFDRAQQRREKKCQDDEREKTAQLFRSMAGMRWTVPSQDQVDPRSGPLIHCPQVPIFYSGGPGYEFGMQKPFGGCQSLSPLLPILAPSLPRYSSFLRKGFSGLRNPFLFESLASLIVRPWKKTSHLPAKRWPRFHLSFFSSFPFPFLFRYIRKIPPIHRECRSGIMASKGSSGGSGSSGGGAEAGAGGGLLRVLNREELVYTGW